MASVAVIRKFLWVIPVLLGLVFIGAGAYMISEGRAAKDDVHQALKAENVVTAEDASIPKALVHNVSTAEAQDAIIRQHSLETTEGKTYAELPRDDPNRGVYLNGATLRAAGCPPWSGPWACPWWSGPPATSSCSHRRCSGRETPPRQQELPGRVG